MYSIKSYQCQLAWFFFRLQKKTLTIEGLEKWAEFYIREEKEQISHSTDEFFSMIMKYGVPDSGNPLPKDDENHYILHEGGFLAGEIERCLRPAENELDLLRGEHALERLGLVLYSGNSLSSIKQYWADEDIKMTFSLVIVEGRWEKYGARLKTIMINALTLGVIDTMIAHGLLTARMYFEKTIYPGWIEKIKKNPWVKRFEKKPPRVNVQDWRDKRKQNKMSSLSENNNNLTTFSIESLPEDISDKTRSL